MRLMRMTVLKISDIRDVEIHRVARAMLKPINSLVRLMYLRSSVGAVPSKVAWLFASVANDGKITIVATITCSPTTSTSISIASVVDLLTSISASVDERRKAVVAVGKTGWTLKSVEEKLAFGGSDIAAISELMIVAARPTLILPRVVATSRGAGVADLVNVVAEDARSITSPAINNN